MDLYEAIEKRKTIRVYKKKATDHQLQKLILAGTKAPSTGNRQPWEFIMVDDQKIIDQLSEIKYQLNRQFTPQAGEAQKEVEERDFFQKKSLENASIVTVCCGLQQAANAWLCSKTYLWQRSQMALAPESFPIGGSQQLRSFKQSS